MGAKVTFDLRAGRISIEGTDKEVIKILREAKAVAPHFKHITIGPETTSQPNNRSEDLDLPGGGGSGRNQEPAIREFGRSLPVNTHYERIAALAYHAIKIDRRASFSPKEMEDWFGLCGFKKPGNMRVALADAKHKYDYVTNKGRGQWTITTGGENLIIEMREKKERA